MIDWLTSTQEIENWALINIAIWPCVATLVGYVFGCVSGYRAVLRRLEDGA